MTWVEIIDNSVETLPGFFYFIELCFKHGPEAVEVDDFLFAILDDLGLTTLSPAREAAAETSPAAA